jgi:hemoglobin/transferrin/lactoferrin receptor protein
MNKRGLFLLFFLFATMGQAQKVSFIGKDSGQPINGVSVSNTDKSRVVYSDNEGFVDLSSFDSSALVFVYHHLYVKEKHFVCDFGPHHNLLKLEKKANTLDEVVLSVSKGREKRSRIAEQIELLTAKEIQRRAPQTSADLLASVPGVKVQKSQLGGGSPVLRGMESNRVLLVVDGVRLNNAIYRKGHLQNSITVAPSLLDRVEVLFGPSSYMYGSDALGGVIHYYTKELKTSQHQITNTSLSSRYGSVNQEWTYHADAELSFRKWASYTCFSNSRFGDLKMGKNRTHGYEDWGKVTEYARGNSIRANSDPNLQKNTGYAQQDFLQKWYFPIFNDLELLLNFQYSSSSNIPRFDKLNEKTPADSLKFAEWHYGPQDRLLVSTQLKLDAAKPYLDKGVLTLAYQDVRESRVSRKFREISNRVHRNERVKVLSLNGDFTVSLTEKNNRNMSYGFELASNQVKSTSFAEQLALETSENIPSDPLFSAQVPTTRYPDGGSRYFTQAAYVGYRQDLDEKHTLNTGLRYSRIQLNAQWKDLTYVPRLSPGISLKNASLTATISHTYRPSQSCKISTVFSSGFRAPNVDDVGKIREKNGTLTVPNVRLKPEYAYNSEFGISQYFNDRMFRLSTNVYYTLLHDYIVRAPFDLNRQREGNTSLSYNGEDGLQVFSNVNRGNAYVTGATLCFQGAFDHHWSAEGSLTYTRGGTYDTKQPMSSIPPLFGNLCLGYKRKKTEIRLDCLFNGAKTPEEYNVEEGIDNLSQTAVLDQNASDQRQKYAGTPSWQILSASFFYELNSKTDVSLQLGNIFDQHYKEFASAISAPGRNFSAAVHYFF